MENKDVKELINEALVNEQLNQAEEKNTKSKKKVWGNVVLLLINIVLVAYIVISYLSSGDSVRLEDLGSFDINYFYLIACFGLLAAVLLLDSLRYYRLIYSFSKVKSFRVSYLVSSYGKYYDYVTPFGSGGQPFQIYFLHKSNVDSDTSVSVPICRFLFNHIALLTFFLFGLIYGLVTKTVSFDIVFILGILAFIGNALFIFAIFFVSFKRDLSYKIITFFLKLLKKMHLIKNYDTLCIKVGEVLDKYKYNLKKVNSNKKEFLFQFISGLITIILNYTFVYLIYLAFVGNFEHTASYMGIITSMVICEMISSVMPLPGGTGAAEFSFISLFTKWFTFSNGKNIVVWAMLIWRCFTYYFYIFQGLVIVIKDTILGIKKDKKFLNKHDDKEKEAITN